MHAVGGDCAVCVACTSSLADPALASQAPPICTASRPRARTREKETRKISPDPHLSDTTTIGGLYSMCVQIDKKYLACGHVGYHGVRMCGIPTCLGPGGTHEVIEIEGRCSDCVRRERIRLMPPPWAKGSRGGSQLPSKPGHA